jgi:CHAT domain-containing protein
MSEGDVTDLLRAYLKLADEQVEDWSGRVFRWAELIQRLHDTPVGDISELVAELPHPELLIAIGHHIDGDHCLAVEAVYRARAALLDEAGESASAASNAQEESLARLSRAAALAVFLARFEAWRDAEELFAPLAAFGWQFSLAEVALNARSLNGDNQTDEALGVALSGVQELQRRRTALSDTSLRLNFGGPSGPKLARLVAIAALSKARSEPDPHPSKTLALQMLDLARDPLLAETVHTISRAPIVSGDRVLIRSCWAVETAAFQWRNLLCQILTERGQIPEARVVAERLEAAEAKAWSTRSVFARLAPSTFSGYFAPGRRLLRSPVDEDVVAEAQTHLGEGTVVLGFDVLEDDVIGWAVTREESWITRLEIPPDRLASQAASVLAASVEGSLASNADLAPLADALLGWADSLLETNERLHLVPTGPLRAIPLGVLPWRGQPLVATHTCSVLPTLGLLADLAARPERDLRQASVAAFGNPIDMRWTSPTGEVIPMEPLRRSGEEAMKVARLARERGEDYTGAKATSKAAFDALQTADILHVATHAVFCAEAPLLSAILLAHGEQLSAIELIATEAACDLIVASACSTGEGVVTAGDDVLGISRGLLACGARAAVVSLWPVDDRRALELMVAFYRQLFKSGDPPQALRSAQESFLDPSGGVSGSERFWAPFVLVGV